MESSPLREPVATEQEASEQEPKQAWQTPELRVLDVEETELGSAVNPDADVFS